MLKVIGLGMIFFSCCGIGAAAARELKRRIRILWELEEGMRLLQGEIRYAKATLPEAFAHVGMRADPLCRSFFREMGDRTAQLAYRSVREAMQNCAAETLKNLCLKREDLERLYRLGEQLGYLDQEMQIKGIEGYLEQQKSVRKEAEKEYREKEKVYHCLGIMGGLFLVILLA